MTRDRIDRPIDQLNRLVGSLGDLSENGGYVIIECETNAEADTVRWRLTMHKFQYIEWSGPIITVYPVATS